MTRTKRDESGNTDTAMASPVDIRTLSPQDVYRCREILHSLPGWFGNEEANRAYVQSLITLPAAVACTDGKIAGFIALTEHRPSSMEIHVMAVDPALHRHGIGRKLVAWAETWCHARGVRWLHVKTRGPSTPDPHYALTRAFYAACGFDPLFETLDLWGPENAALVMVKRVGYDRPGTMTGDADSFGED